MLCSDMVNSNKKTKDKPQTTKSDINKSLERFNTRNRKSIKHRQSTVFGKKTIHRSACSINTGTTTSKSLTVIRWSKERQQTKYNAEFFQWLTSNETML